MKRIVLILVATFMMGGMVMAQHAHRDDKKPDPKVRAEHMTERMVKEYALNDTQKKQLLEANLALMEKVGDMPMHRRADKKRGMKAGCDSCTCSKTDKHHEKHNKAGKREGKRPELTNEQRAQKKAEMAKKFDEMKTARTTYNAQLEQIMTKEQYAAYNKKMQDRKDKKMDAPKKSTK